MRRYWRNCAWLLLPVMLWNAAFASRLPPAFQAEEFWRDIPRTLAWTENGLRVLVFMVPGLMPLHWDQPPQRRLLLLFGLSTMVYFASWLPLMFAADSVWATSALGFTAPAWTPALWLGALARVGRELFWGSFYRWWMYLALSMAFLVAHIAHTALVFARSQ